MLVYILIGVAVAIVGLLAFASTKPNRMTVTRELVIPSSPEKIFPHVVDLHKWNDWSPWAKIDPNAKITYSGTEKGTGASMAWDGNKDVGAGSITITDNAPDKVINIRLDFIKPFKGTSDVRFDFVPGIGGTNVRWTMDSKNNMISKVMSCFIDCEKMIGDQYDKGLNNLKSVVEKQAA